MIFYSSRELAKFLGCHYISIGRWLNEGLPHEKGSREYVYNLEPVLNWLESRSKRNKRWVASIRKRMEE